MRGKVALVLTLLAAAALTAAAASFVAGRDRTVKAMPECPAGRPVVIDPGHGGIDGGANVPNFMLEKAIVLDVALRLKSYLEMRGIPVVLTRTTDVDLGGQYDGSRLTRDLHFRSGVANQCQGSLMLSIHVNSAANTAERGMMIFYQSSRPSRDAAFFFDQLLRSRGLNGRDEAPHPRDTFHVLRAVKAPALLLELGFITNAADRQLLADVSFRDQVAEALAGGCETIYQKWTK
ncbi:MAG: N-acetylmuramoyl-L-alanine amidase family protein [Mycobacterium leprae]